jgi:hypothetical protein
LVSILQQTVGSAPQDGARNNLQENPMAGQGNPPAEDEEEHENKSDDN